MPKVSVVIPTYNYGRYVGEAVESVLKQSFQDLEVIVVDDGSTDDTRERLERFRGRIRYIYQQNKGLSVARNTGIRAAHGAYVAFLDSDDLWLPEKLALQVPILDTRQQVGMVYTDVQFFNDQTKAIIGTHGPKDPHPSGRILSQLVLWNVIPSPTPLVRRSIFDRAGLFDENLTASEDWDLWIRIAKVCEVYCVDLPLAKYRLHISNMHRNLQRMKESQLAVLDKIFADPRLPKDVIRLRQRAYSKVYENYSALCFLREEYDLARRDFIRAVKLNPRILLNWPVLPCLICSLLGARFTTQVRSYKRKVFSRLSSLRGIPKAGESLP